MANGTSPATTTRQGLIVTTSGQWVGFPDELESQLRGIIRRAVVDGMYNAVGQRIDKVAFETGELRTAFLKAMIAAGALTRVDASGDIVLEWGNIESAIIGLDPKAEHHIDGRPWHPGDTSYVRPNVPGTRPILSYDVMEVAAQEIRSLLNQYIMAAGFESL